MRKIAAWLLSVVLLVVAAGCTSGGTPSGDGKLKVTATTGMIADLVANIGGEHVTVTGLMGTGVDPHLYKASEGDIARLTEAQIIFYNGLHLEGRMGDILVRMARQKPTVAVAEGINEELLLQTEEETEDPHIWFDVSLWMEAAKVVRDSLIEVDPKHKAAYEQNTQAYLKELEDLHTYAKQQIATIPAAHRVLVTAHDAFGYFGRAYDIEVTGIQGISTVTEFGLSDLQELVEVLVTKTIRAVFVESSVPTSSIDALVQGARARGHEVSVGGELFSDAMGKAGTVEGTYIGMVRHNVDTIVAALR